MVACCIAAALMLVLKRDSARLIAGLAVFCAIVRRSPLARQKNTGDFSVYRSTAELQGYQAGYDMMRLISKYDRPSSRVLLWAGLRGLGGRDGRTCGVTSAPTRCPRSRR